MSEQATETNVTTTPADDQPKVMGKEGQPEAAVAASASGEAAKPAAPAEAPVTTDALKQATARFTYRAWHLFLEYEQDLEKIKSAPLRCSLKAKTPEGLTEIEGKLREAMTNNGLSGNQVTRHPRHLEFTAPFLVVQAVIKHPETTEFDAVAL